MLQVIDFKKISVKDIRKIIKELDLKKKKKELKGYSYKKKKDLINLLLDMDIPMSILNKYRKVKGQKKNIKMKIEEKIEEKSSVEKEQMFNILEVAGGQVKKIFGYENREEAINKFRELSNNNKKVYLMEGDEVIRSSINPEIRMNGKSRFKAHLMYKGKKKVMADTPAEHMKLKQIGYTHSKGDNPGHSKKNSPKAKMTAQMNKIEPSY